ncbi:orotidine-5'-phosphate decarboxylase [Pelagibacterales bacterium SAG-MED31]|nr:orotidine-5'-phosphate decarboxylase [Pelagibacterales bacterium SAG-MED31]
MTNKVIIALDNKNIKQIVSIVKETKSEAFGFKIGKEFFYNYGIEGYKKIYNLSPKIFLDLKLHDIPNTVQKALKALIKLKPLFTTIHISGGDDMQKVSSNIKKNKTKILGVTILTSLSSQQTKKYYNDKNINQLVKKFAQNAKNNKLDGIVCSPLELKTVRKVVGNKMILVVPGIRLEKNKKNDQKRILTPKEAINLGANYLVIGRPIVQSTNPLKTLKEINKSLQSK